MAQITAKKLSFEVTLNETLSPAQKIAVVKSIERLFTSYLPETEVKVFGKKITVSVTEVDKFTRLKFQDARNKLTWNRQVDLEKESSKTAETAYQPSCPMDGSFDVSPSGKDGFKCNSCGETWKNPGFDQQEVDDFAFDLDDKSDDVNLDEGVDRKKLTANVVCLQCGMPNGLIKDASGKVSECIYCSALIDETNPVDQDFSGEDLTISCPFCGSEDCADTGYEGNHDCHGCGQSFHDDDMIKESSPDSLGDVQDHVFAAYDA